MERLKRITLAFIAVGFVATITGTCQDATATTFEARIAVGNDDGEEKPDGTATHYGGDLDMDPAESPYCGIRFVVNIPQGSSITTAYVQFTARSTNSGTTSITIYGEDADNAPAILLEANNLSSRTPTTASVTWAPNAWTIDGAGPDQQTPDISSIVEEIVGRAGWSSGNALFLVFNTTTGRRSARTYNNDPNAAALITVDYPGKYTLTVNSGSGDGDYEPNTVVDILADSLAGQNFDVWTGDTATIDDVAEPNTTITIPESNTEITATYVDDPNTFSLIVNSGSGDGVYDSNTIVNILADAPGAGQLFNIWTGDANYVANVNEANTTFTMPEADAEITATYQDDANTYQLTVNSGTGDGYYEPSTVVGITADAPGGGQEFDVWTGDTNYVADVNQPNTTVDMPALDIGVTATYTAVPPAWTHFLHNEADGNGDYLWSYPNNWSAGLPGTVTSAEIGEDSAGEARHCVLYASGVQCLHFELAEHGGTEGSSLHVKQGASLTFGGTVNIAKDREGWFYIDGTVSHLLGNKTFRVGGQWGQPDSNLPSKGHVLIGSTGVLEAWFVGINTIRTAESIPSSPWGPTYWSKATDSEVIVDGGALTAQQGLRMSTVYANRPGLLKLSGTASFTTNPDATYGIDIWCGTWQIDGGDANIHVGDIELWGNKFANEVSGGTGNPVGAGVSILKFSGNGVSTIYATSADFIDAAYLDVTDLNVPEAAYKIIDATTITDANDCLAFVAGTDMNVWSFQMYEANGDLFLTYGTPLYELTVNSGSGDGYYEASTVVDILADSPSLGQLFDVWTGDTAGVDNANEANTTYTMPAAAAEITAAYTDDSNTFALTVDFGSGDGLYDPNTVVNILADTPQTAKIFDVWTGDTASVDDVTEANTTVIMPEADVAVTATYADNPNYGGPRGYSARPCGFDMNRNGIIGEGADRTVGDGSTTDPDGDSTDEDLIYVDATDGNDPTGDGSASNPYKTVQYALNQADGPGDGAEDIVCIAGVFNEELTLTQSGVTGYYTMDNFQFPDNPFMLIGWDKDADGEYPPYDADDTAVLDGNVGPNSFLAINNQAGAEDYVEIAHLAMRYYGRNFTGNPQGAMRIAPDGGVVSHIYFHDVEMTSINDAIQGDSQTSIWSFWCGSGTLTYIAFINNLVDGTSYYVARGAPGNGSGYFRLRNNTINFTVGEYQDSNMPNLGTTWKVWGEHSNVEILNNVINGATSDSADQTIAGGGIGIRPCVRNYTVRNNALYNARGGIGIDGLSEGGCHSRSIDEIVIDRNIIRNAYTGWNYGYMQSILINEGGSTTAETVEDVTITNNFISILDTSQPTRGFQSHLGNDGGPQVGVITFAGNTIYGPGSGVLFRAMSIYSIQAYPQEDYVIKNNIIANVGGYNLNMRVSHDPNGWIANGNIYDDDGNFNWDPNFGARMTFSEWQTASGQDGSSRTGDPVFVDEASGDFHIDPNDTLVEGAGVDITDITTADIDGDERTAGTPWPGADVRPETQQPTILAWHSAAAHGRSVGEALLEIHDDGNFSEPRSDGISKLILVFDEPIDPASLISVNVAIAGLDANNAPIDCNSIAIGTSTRNGNTEAVITFTPALPDYAKYKVAVSGVTDAVGNPLAGDADRIMTALIGDVSADRRVNATDLSDVRATRTRLINKNNSGQVRADVSQDGRVNAADRSRVRVRRDNDARGISDPTIP